MKEKPLLAVNHLTTRLQFGPSLYPVVENVCFELFQGKTLAIVGESGCGKTLTALSLMRIQPSPPALSPEGEVIYKGRNLLTLSEKEMRKIRGARIAMIFQDPTSALNPVYTIGEQLKEAALIHLDIDEEEAENRAIRALDEVGILSPIERLYDYPHQLSGGMKQRIMIAMALIGEPDILIADEPTTALDVTIQAQVLDLMRMLQKRKGMAILLITHDMGIVAEMADEVVVMYASQGIEKGTVSHIFHHMAHPYTRGLFQSRPTGNIARAPLYPIQGNVPSVTHYPTGCRFHPRCPFIMEKCKKDPVPSFTINGDTDHQTLCWLYDGTPESMERKPKI